MPALVAALTSQAGATVHYTYQFALKGFAATLPPQAVDGIANNPNVAYILPDGIATTTGSGMDNTVSSWGLDRIDQRDLPLSNSYQWNTDGAGVTAYILDTGIRTTHSQFGTRASVGYDALGGDGQDCHGHGTHVAGTVGGSEYGVARAVNLVAVRVMGCGGSGAWSGIVAGIDYVRQHAIKPAVANMSIGGGLFAAVDDAVTNAINAGVVFAVSAGNSNADACLQSPAATPKALTVGSTTSTDARSSFSNFGTCVDMFAPGSSITSAYYTGDAATATMSGTSMASPHVAGVAALYLSANKTATPAQVEAALETAATPDKVTSAGAGSPNLLLYSLVTSAGTNSPPTASFTRSCSNLACSFNGTGSSDTDGSVVNYAWAFGDGTTASGATPNKTYAASGTYSVTLTVTDDDGATGSASQSVTVSSASGGITLSATGYKVKGLQKVNLTWTGATTAVDIYRDNVKVVTGTSNDGSHTDEINKRGGGSYTYRVCLTGSTTCSGDVTVNF